MRCVDSMAGPGRPEGGGHAAPGTEQGGTKAATVGRSTGSRNDKIGKVHFTDDVVTLQMALLWFTLASWPITSGVREIVFSSSSGRESEQPESSLLLLLL